MKSGRRQHAETGMIASDVADLYKRLAAQGIGVWIDGGWGVDALLGEQTRIHSDVDILAEEKDLASLRKLLEGQGFSDLPQPDTRPWNFVLADRDGRRVDVHLIVLDRDGNGIYGPPQNGQSYPAAALSGRGVIGGLPVRCLTPEYQMDRKGYPLRETDRHDVRALAEKFGLGLPGEYRSES